MPDQCQLPVKAGDRWGRTVQTLVRGALLVASVLVTEPALAHTESGAINSGFFSGFAHPIFGWDHVIAMVAVGLWGAFLGARNMALTGRFPARDGIRRSARHSGSAYSGR